MLEDKLANSPLPYGVRHRGKVGMRSAARSRDDLVKQMTPSQIAEAQQLARNFKPKKEKSKQ